MRSFAWLSLLITLAFSIPLQAGDGEFCGVKNTAFQANESITYRVYYTLAGVYIAAGEATFTTVLDNLNGKPVYHVTGEGKTYSFYDNFFQ
ncbi:MAG TPA: DUF3108 domain-containing protein, partial [Puia sp.]|nr:DUF3108 domain-containing protein [Puia sp.]